MRKNTISGYSTFSGKWNISRKRLTQIYSPITFIELSVVVVVDDFNAKVIPGLFYHSWHTCWVPTALSALLAKETILIKDLKVLSSEIDPAEKRFI
jgi:hypothetical protein